MIIEIIANMELVLVSVKACLWKHSMLSTFTSCSPVKIPNKRLLKILTFFAAFPVF